MPTPNPPGVDREAPEWCGSEGVAAADAERRLRVVRDDEGVAAEIAAPSGTVTFLFTDVVGSTRLWAHEPSAMAPALEAHDDMVREAVDSGGGYVFTTAGDAFAAAFASADDAVAAAESIQDRMAGMVWPTSEPLRVRVGLHAGAAIERDGDYFGPVLNTAARVQSAANPGQVVATAAVRELAAVEMSALGSHRLRDIPDPVELFQVGLGEFGALRSLDAVISTLPTMGSRLIGREDEVAEVRRALQASRLVSVTGVGGCGKTRLAVEVGGRELPDVGHVFFVDLTKAVDADAVVGQVVVGVGLVLNSLADPLDALVGYLSDRASLLVLDNCEHLLDASADVVEELLEQCGGLRVLATSREALGIDAERVWRIPSLGSGQSGAGPQLFIERAMERDPAFAVGAAQQAVVTEICERLDGIPLAIELAAARTTSMAVDEILDRLDDRFRLLTGGRRRARQRQQTLESVVQWSHDLLSDDERVMLRRLAVFEGGFSGTDAGAVTGFDDYHALDLVEALVSKSLVDAARIDGGVPRLRLLETVRLFAQQRLEDAGEQAQIRDAHRDHFIGSGSWSSLVEGFSQRDLLIRQIAEVDNVSAAIEWACERGDDLQAALAVARHTAAMNATGGSSRFMDLITADYPDATDAQQATLLAMRSNFAIIGLLNDAELAALAEETAALFDSGNTDDDLFYALTGVGFHADPNRLADVERYRRSATANDAAPAVRAGLDLAVSEIHLMHWRTDEAVELYEQALELTPDTIIGSLAGYLLTSVLTLQGDTDRATDTADSLQVVPGSFADAQPLAVAVAAISEGHPERGGRLLAQTARRTVTGRVLAQEGDYLCWFAWIRHLSGDNDRASELLHEHTSRFSRRLAVLIGQHIHNWTAEQTRDQMLIATGHIRDPEQTRRLLNASSRLLESEVDEWDP